MLAVGLCPGLESLVYVVLDFGRSEIAHVINCDTLHVRGQNRLSQAAELMKKANVHRLVLSVVLERGATVAVGCGPPALKSEPKEHVEAARAMIEELCREQRIRLLSVPDVPSVLEILREASEERVEARTLRPTVDAFLRTPLPTKNARVLWAAACCVCAWHVARQTF